MWRLMVSQANQVDQVIVPSGHFAAKLIDQGVRTPVSVLSNGLEDSVLDAVGEPAPRTLTPGEELRVMWCGRVSPEKRPEVFVEAMARLDGARGDMFGDGVARAAVAARVSELPPGTVEVRGPVPQEQVLEGMRDAHVLVSSSFDFDNQPMVLLEGVASGLPVIITDPDLAEMLPPGGFLVTETPDAAGLTLALQQLRERPELVAEMSAAAIAHREKVSQTAHRDALLDVYRAALGAGRKGAR